MDFGQRIRYLREKRGMTQDELAHKVGYSGKSTIAKVESGAFDVTRSKVAKFARVLKTTPSYLMGWVDDPRKNINDDKSELDQIMDYLPEDKQCDIVKYARYVASSYKNETQQDRKVNEEIARQIQEEDYRNQ